MNVSQQGIDLIKAFEGCKLVAYKPVTTERYYTIGYGHYGADVTKGMQITKEKAEELLRADIVPIEKVLNSLGVNFMQRQFDALCSWIYNLGVGNFNKSTLRKYIIGKKEDIDITNQMAKWYNAGGKPLLGLKRRRVAECNMFLGKKKYYITSSGTILKR